LTTTPDPFYDFTVHVKESLGADRCTFWIVDRERRDVWAKVALGLEGEDLRVPMHRGVVGYVARTGQPLRLKDVYNDPRFDRTVDQRTGYRTKSLLTMAVRNQQRAVLAVLQALNKASGPFDENDEARMVQFCQEAADLLDREGIPSPN